MRRPGSVFALVVGGLVCVGVATAADASKPAHDPARARVAAVHQAVARHAAEVARLERSVAEQEARSRQASIRLSEQDRALERLRRELQAAGVSEQTVAAGPDRAK